jgi:hypothetical protein
MFRAARNYFQMIGCRAAGAASGFDALEVLKENKRHLVVLLVDSDLANLGRAEFSNAARAIVPSVCIATVAIAGSVPPETEEAGPVSRTRFTSLYDAVVRALAGMPH